MLPHSHCTIPTTLGDLRPQVMHSHTPYLQRHVYSCAATLKLHLHYNLGQVDVKVVLLSPIPLYQDIIIIIIIIIFIITVLWLCSA